MKLCEIVFSPTGGTQKVAELLCAAWQGERERIDLSLADADFGKFTFERGDICLVAVPSFGGRVPDVAAERLKTIHGGGARAVLAAVYGNREIDDTLIELEDILAAAGFAARLASPRWRSTVWCGNTARAGPTRRTKRSFGIFHGKYSQSLPKIQTRSL